MQIRVIFRLVQRFARVVLGYHGCLEPFASQVLTGEAAIDEWPKSRNTWDWLGEGIYFWEHAPERALRWAQHKVRHEGADLSGAKPAVVGAVIQLGACFDLTNVVYTEMLREAHQQVDRRYRTAAKPLPTNRGVGEDLPRRELDCLVINYCLEDVFPEQFQTVRGAFWEGEPAFPGAMIRKESHIQVAVRDRSCILGVFRPRLDL